MAAGVELYLIRHGIAAERGDAYPDDSKRPLTNEGISRLKQIAAGLSRLGVSFDQILTSPLTRAKQTADVFAAEVDGKPPISVAQSLAPGGKFPALIDDLSKYSRRSRIALVGHEPDLGQLAARLVGARAPLEFKKGGVARIDVDSLPPTGPGHLRWFATPKMLRNNKK
jgi:phosphohistidine phosphatase